MDGHYITTVELITITALGLALPVLLAAVAQGYIFKSAGFRQSYCVALFLVTILLSCILGFVFWGTLPVLTTSWQHFVMRAAMPHAQVVGVLVFIPLLPMLMGTVVAVITVSSIAMWRKNA